MFLCICIIIACFNTKVHCQFMYVCVQIHKATFCIDAAMNHNRHSFLMMFVIISCGSCQRINERKPYSHALYHTILLYISGLVRTKNDCDCDQNLDILTQLQCSKHISMISDKINMIIPRHKHISTHSNSINYHRYPLLYFTSFI